MNGSDKQLMTVFVCIALSLALCVWVAATHQPQTSPPQPPPAVVVVAPTTARPDVVRCADGTGHVVTTDLADAARHELKGCH